MNKNSELNIMVHDSDPHIIGITESLANKDVTDAELGLPGYVMFRKDMMEEGAEQYYCTSEILYQHTKYNYGRKQIAKKPYDANYLQDITIGVVYRCPNMKKKRAMKN